MADAMKSGVSIATLSTKKQLAFALLVFERMLPALIVFSKETGFDESCYLQAREAAWGALEGGHIDESLNHVCLKSAPDTEDFSHELTSDALNAALAMSDILEFVVDGEARHIAYIATLATDSVHMFLSGLDPSPVYTPELERWIAAHPLMQQELLRQEEDVRFLAALPDRFDAQTVAALKARVSTQTPLFPLTR